MSTVKPCCQSSTYEPSPEEIRRLAALIRAENDAEGQRRPQCTDRSGLTYGRRGTKKSGRRSDGPRVYKLVFDRWRPRKI